MTPQSGQPADAIALTGGAVDQAASSMNESLSEAAERLDAFSARVEQATQRISKSAAGVASESRTALERVSSLFSALDKGAETANRWFDLHHNVRELGLSLTTAGSAANGLWQSLLKVGAAASALGGPTAAATVVGGQSLLLADVARAATGTGRQPTTIVGQYNRRQQRYDAIRAAAPTLPLPLTEEQKFQRNLTLMRPETSADLQTWQQRGWDKVSKQSKVIDVMKREGAAPFIRDVAARVEKFPPFARDASAEKRTGEKEFQEALRGEQATLQKLIQEWRDYEALIKEAKNREDAFPNSPQSQYDRPGNGKTPFADKLSMFESRPQAEFDRRFIGQFLDAAGNDAKRDVAALGPRAPDMATDQRQNDALARLQADHLAAIKEDVRRIPEALQRLDQTARFN